MTLDDGSSRRTFLAQSLAVGAAGAIALGEMPAAGAEPAPAEKAAQDDGWQIGCYTRPWAEHEYRVALDAIAEAGFKFAGLMTTRSPTHLVLSAVTPPEEAERIGREARKRGLKLASAYGGDIPVNRSLEAGIEGLRKLIDNCAVAGVASVLMGGVGDEKLYDVYYKAIAECCDYAAEKRVEIALKPHGGLNATGPQCRKTVEKVGHRSFRIWYDPGNIYYYSDGRLDPVDDAPSVDGLVSGMCVKDYQHPKKVDVTPGTGKVDFAAVMAKLRRGGFRSGPLVVETLAPGDLGRTLAEAKKARAFLEQLVGPDRSASRPV